MSRVATPRHGSKGKGGARSRSARGISSDHRPLRPCPGDCPQDMAHGNMARMTVQERLDAIYAIAQHRAGYSREEDAAHELAAGWLREAGLEVSRDGAGNLFGKRGDARVWAGSHLDSVP